MERDPDTHPLPDTEPPTPTEVAPEPAVESPHLPSHPVLKRILEHTGVRRPHWRQHEGTQAQSRPVGHIQRLLRERR